MRVVQTVGGLFSSAGCLRCASVSMRTFEWPAACANSPALGHTTCASSSALPSGAPPLGRPVRFSDQRWSSCCSCGRARAETPPSDDSQAAEGKGERLRPRRSSGGTLAATGGVLATFVVSHFLAGSPPPTCCPDGGGLGGNTRPRDSSSGEITSMKIDGAALWYHVCNHAWSQSYMHDTVTPVTAPHSPHVALA